MVKKGTKLSEETKRKLSESHKGQTSWNKGKKGLQIAWNKGKKGQVPWNKGKKEVYSEASKLKMSLARKGRFGGEKHPMFGKSHSKESKQRMSQSQKGRIPWNKGKPFPLESKQKMSQARLGKIPWNKGKTGIFSEEARRKNAEAHKGHIPWNKDKTGIFSEEARRKNALAHTNPPEEIRKKIREARLKQIFPKKDSKPEKIMQKTLSLYGIDFKKHIPIHGQPDIFIEPNICIFVDGDYWHGNPLYYKPDFQLVKGTKGYTVQEKWRRDEKITYELLKKGYLVFRFWESDIKKDVNECVEKILSKSHLS